MKNTTKGPLIIVTVGALAILGAFVFFGEKKPKIDVPKPTPDPIPVEPPEPQS